eukprot:13259439-Alexandrium_andersonii.AAC.1
MPAAMLVAMLVAICVFLHAVGVPCILSVCPNVCCYALAFLLAVTSVSWSSLWQARAMAHQWCP